MLANTGCLCSGARRGWRSSVWATAIGAAVLFLGSAAWAQGQTSGDPNAPALRLINIIPINGTAASPRTQMFSFDISWWDPTTGLYVLADRSNAALDVIDTTGNFTGGRADTLFGQIGGASVGFAGDTGTTSTSGPNGVTVAPNLPCIFATDTFSAATRANTSGRVVSFNYNASFTTVVSSVNTGGTHRADEMAFDPRDNLILAVNNADTPPFFTLISVNPSTCALAVVRQTLLNTANGVNATNGAEQPVWMGGTINKFFLSIPEVNGPGDGSGTIGAVAQINTSGAIEGLFQVNFCQPAGLTIGPNGDLLVGCGAVFDTSGAVCSAPVPDGRPATCTGIAAPQMAICNPGRGCTDGALVSVPGVGGTDEVWFNSGDGNYYIAARNDPIGPVFGVVASGVNTLNQLVPTLPPTPAVTTGTRRSSGTAHSIAASAANNHVYVPLPANTSYQINGVGCAQGCVAVFSAQ
jgi:hypothetical protein